MSYVGNRDGFRDALTALMITAPTADDASTRVIDLVAMDPADRRVRSRALETGRPTVIVSSRRVDVGDTLGETEARLLADLDHAVLLRCAPLEESLDSYRYWAELGGVLLSSIHDGGVAWIALQDLAEATRAAGRDAVVRAGRAFDVTGPLQVPMADVAAALSADIGRDISHERLTPEAFEQVLLRNGVPAPFAAWLPAHQEQTSDPALPGTTPVLAALLGRPPSFPVTSRPETAHIREESRQ